MLGEIVAQHLEHRLGEKVDRKLNLGGTLLAHQALVNGKHRRLPGVHGHGAHRHSEAAAFAPMPRPCSKPCAPRTAGSGIWSGCEPLGFNNTFAMVIRGADARARTCPHAERCGALSARLDAGRRLRIPAASRRPARPAEDVSAAACGSSPVSMDLGLLYQALDQKKVDMVAGSETDGLLSRTGCPRAGGRPALLPAVPGGAGGSESALSGDPRVRQALGELRANLRMPSCAS